MKAKFVPVYALLAAFALLMAAFPARYVPVCFEGLALWAECVAPALLPFMIISLIFIKTGCAARAARPFRDVCRLFGLPPAAAAIFVMSALSGYPAGSRIVCEYCERGEITPSDARRLAALCSTSGPMFLMGSVGGRMLGDARAGWLLYGAHLLSVAAVALALCAATKKPAPLPRRLTADGDGDVLYSAFSSAVMSVLTAGAFICFFYTLSAALQGCGAFALPEALLRPLLGTYSEGFCRGLVEATGGCAAAAAMGGRLALPLCGAMATFGGASILAQQLCYLTKCGVKPLQFIAVKAAQAALCFVILLPFGGA